MQSEEIQERLQRLIRRYGTPPVATEAEDTSRNKSGPAVIQRVNHACGDAVELRVDEEEDAFHLRVKGCSICRAAAVVVEHLIRPSSPAGLTEDLIAALRDPDVSPDSILSSLQDDTIRQDVEDLVLIAYLPGRRRCATLPLETVMDYYHAHPETAG